MDNNQQPKFDPETGKPLTPPQAPQEQAPKFDPETGKLLDPPPAPQEQAPKFDPQTGKPLDPPPAPQAQRLDNGFVPPQPQPGVQAQFTQQTPPQQAKMQKPSNPYAVGSLICGIASLVLCCCTYLSLALGIVAIVLAVLSKKGAPTMSGMALGGMICGIVGGGIAIIGIIASFFMQTTVFSEEIISDIFNDIQH